MVAGTAQTQSKTTPYLHLFVDRRSRPKFRHRKRLLVPAYKLVNNPGYPVDDPWDRFTVDLKEGKITAASWHGDTGRPPVAAGPRLGTKLLEERLDLFVDTTGGSSVSARGAPTSTASNEDTSCSFPSSVSRKSSLPRPRTGFPSASSTTMSTATTVTSEGNRVAGCDRVSAAKDVAAWMVATAIVRTEAWIPWLTSRQPPSSNVSD